MLATLEILYDLFRFYFSAVGGKQILIRLYHLLSQYLVNSFIFGLLLLKARQLFF